MQAHYCCVYLTELGDLRRDERCEEQEAFLIGRRLRPKPSGKLYVCRVFVQFV